MDIALSDKVPSTPLTTVLNFRDVGKTINILLNSDFLREGVIYRSARPDDASPSDRLALTTKYHIKAIIDLRSTTEHIDQAKKRDANVKIHASKVALQSDEKAADVIKLPGVSYHDVNLNGGAFARALLWKLRWSSLAKLIALMASGYRNEGIAILGREVMAPRGLVGLGKDTLDHSHAELNKILFLLADSTNYPILVHCTQGKDRTGLVAMLLLLLLDVPGNLISADYVASERELQWERQVRVQEIQSVGLGEEFAGCPKGFVEEMVKHINQEYGSLRGYMRKIGISEWMLKRARENLRLQGLLESE